MTEERAKMTKKVYEGHLNAQGKKFGIVVSRFNDLVTAKLVEGAIDCLVRHGADEEEIAIARVPGAFELPLGAKKMAATGRFDAIVCLGAIVRSDTPHFDFVAGEASKGIAQVGLDSGIPTIFGVITADTVDQAIQRAGVRAGNRGWDAGLTAVEMANLMDQFS